MKWHKATELPQFDTEVLAEISNGTFSHYAILAYDGIITKGWKYIPLFEYDPMGGKDLPDIVEILRWAYID